MYMTDERYILLSKDKHLFVLWHIETMKQNLLDFCSTVSWNLRQSANTEKDFLENCDRKQKQCKVFMLFSTAIYCS